MQKGEVCNLKDLYEESKGIVHVAKIIICIYGERDWDQEGMLCLYELGESQSRGY